MKLRLGFAESSFYVIFCEQKIHIFFSLQNDKIPSQAKEILHTGILEVPLPLFFCIHRENIGTHFVLSMVLHLQYQSKSSHIYPINNFDLSPDISFNTCQISFSQEQKKIYPHLPYIRHRHFASKSVETIYAVLFSCHRHQSTFSVLNVRQVFSGILAYMSGMCQYSLILHTPMLLPLDLMFSG